jgi:hypothetical protein
MTEDLSVYAVGNRLPTKTTVHLDRDYSTNNEGIGYTTSLSPHRDCVFLDPGKAPPKVHKSK